MTNEQLLEMTKFGHCHPFLTDSEAISRLAAELLRVRMIVQTQSPAYIVRGDRYIADWAKAILNGEDL